MLTRYSLGLSALFLPFHAMAKDCDRGKPCGDTCIAVEKTCHVDGWEASAFDATPYFDSQQRSAPDCRVGKPCGRTCIEATDTCHVTDGAWAPTRYALPAPAAGAPPSASGYSQSRSIMVDAGLESYRKRRPVWAIISLNGAIHSGIYEDEEDRARYYIGMSLWDLNLRAQASRWFRGLWRDRDSSYAPYAGQKYLALASMRFDAGALVEFDEDSLPRGRTRDAVVLAHAIQSFEAGEGIDLAALRKVDSANPEFAGPARVLAGISKLDRGDSYAAKLLFEEAIDIIDHAPPRTRSLLSHVADAGRMDLATALACGGAYPDVGVALKGVSPRSAWRASRGAVALLASLADSPSQPDRRLVAAVERDVRAGRAVPKSFLALELAATAGVALRVDPAGEVGSAMGSIRSVLREYDRETDPEEARSVAIMVWNAHTGGKLDAKLPGWFAGVLETSAGHQSDRRYLAELAEETRILDGLPQDGGRYVGNVVDDGDLRDAYKVRAGNRVLRLATSTYRELRALAEILELLPELSETERAQLAGRASCGFSAVVYP